MTKSKEIILIKLTKSKEIILHYHGACSWNLQNALWSNCTKTVANMVKTPPLRPFSCIFFGCLKKKEYLCDTTKEQKIMMV